MVMKRFVLRRQPKVITKEETNPDDVANYWDGNVFVYRGAEINDNEKDAITQVKVAGITWEIHDFAFRGCTKIVHLEMKQQQVSRIGIGSFKNCSGLVQIDIIGGNVEDIGAGAFYGCHALEGLVLPSSVRLLGEATFHNCYKLEHVELPESIQEIGPGAFYGCSSLKSVELPRSVQKLGQATFYNCTGITSVRLPESMEEIGTWSFAGCSRLRDVQLPKSIKKLGEGAFQNCSAIEFIELPNALQEIGKEAFSGCSSLTRITLPNSLEKLRQGTFSNCSGLTSIDLADSIQEIDSFTFQGCSSLRKISLPSSVAKIAEGTFHRCCGLAGIELPDTIQEIEKRSFSGCSSLRNVRLSRYVKKLEESTFSNCSALASIDIPVSVKEIGPLAFSGCVNLLAINIPTSVRSIDIQAFTGCTSLERALEVSGQTNIATWLKHRFDDFPLHKLCFSQHTSPNDIVQYKTHLDRVDPAGMTPLHYLACSRFLSGEIVQYYLREAMSEGCNKHRLLTLTDMNGRSPVHYACQNSYATMDVIQTLTDEEYHNLFGKRDRDSNYPTTLAIESGLPTNIQQWLFNRQPVQPVELRNLTIAQARLIIKNLAETYVDLIVSKENWDMGLSKAEQHGWVELVSSDILSPELISKLAEYISNSDTKVAKVLAYALDNQGRMAMTNSVGAIRDSLMSSLLFFGKYNLDDTPKYESQTCKVYFAEMMEMVDTDVDDVKKVSSRPVALKFMYDENHFSTEMYARFFDPYDTTTSRFDAKYIIQALAFHDGNVDKDFAAAVQNRVGQLSKQTTTADGACLPMYCIVLEQGERNLLEALASENISQDESKVRGILKELAMCLQHVHEQGYVHGDFKPRNCVRQVDDRKWNLIDFDATIEINSCMVTGQKISTAYMPPEMTIDGADTIPTIRRATAAAETTGTTTSTTTATTATSSFLEQESNINNNQGMLLSYADPSYDVWSFGMVAFQLITGEQFFDRVNYLQDNLDQKDLRTLALWNDKRTMNRVNNVSSSISGLAREFLCTILRIRPNDRPTMGDILEHDYFKVEELLEELRKAKERNDQELVRQLSTTVATAMKKSIGTNLERMERNQDRILSNQRIVLTNQLELSDKVMEITDQLQKMEIKFTKFLGTIARGGAMPRYCIVVPEEDSTSSSSSSSSTVKKWWDKILSPIQQKVRIYFVCPVLLQVPRNDNGEAIGYTLSLPRKWVVKYGPAILLGIRFIQLGCATGRLVGLPLPNLGGKTMKNIVNDLSLVYVDIFKAMKNDIDEDDDGDDNDDDNINENENDDNDEGTISQAGTVLDSFADSIESTLDQSNTKGTTNLLYDTEFDDNDNDDGLIERSAESIRSIGKILDDEEFEKCGLVKVVCDADGTVDFVHPSIKTLFERRGSSCYRMSPFEIGTYVGQMTTTEENQQQEGRNQQQEQEQQEQQQQQQQQQIERNVSSVKWWKKISKNDSKIKANKAKKKKKKLNDEINKRTLTEEKKKEESKQQKVDQKEDIQ